MKIWKGKMIEMMTVRFEQKASKWTSAFSGEAVVYRFESDDLKCKVSYAALIRGVEKETLCSSSGAVGQAILKASGLQNKAKNSPVTSEYEFFPAPIGRPVEHLESWNHLDPTGALTFYKKV